MRVIFTSVLLLLTSAVSAGHHEEPSCHKLYQLTDLSYAVEPGKIIQATEFIPEHCKVRAVINRAIQVEVTMPTKNWNGRLMFSTVGAPVLL